MGPGGHAVNMPTLSWMVGDLGGGMHTASVTSVAPGACDHISFGLFTACGAFTQVGEEEA